MTNTYLKKRLASIHMIRKMPTEVMTGHHFTLRILAKIKI